MTPTELLDELRRECPDVRIDYYRGVPAIIWMTPAQLEIIVTKREHAAAERMRERCAAYISRKAERAKSGEEPFDGTLKDCAEELDAMPIDELEPEEPSE